MDKATKDQENKVRRFVDFCVQRSHTALTEEQIATRLGFRSPRVLYKQLENDGSPVCGVCGQLYPEPDHHKEHKQKRQTRQPGVGGGRGVKLPDASGALDLFRATLEELERRI